MGKNEVVQFRKIGELFWWNNNNILWSFKYLLIIFWISKSIVSHFLPTAMGTIPSS